MAAHPEHTILPLPRFDRPVKLALVVAPYYRAIAEALVAGAEATAARAGAAVERFDGFVALGCIIRGETTHYDTVCNDSSRGLMLLGLGGAAIGNGILTVETMAQAEVRADPAGQDKGGGAAAAALHLVALARAFGASRRGVGFNAHLGTQG